MSRLLHAATPDLRCGALWKVPPSEAVILRKRCLKLETVMLNPWLLLWFSVETGSRCTSEQVLHVTTVKSVDSPAT